MQPIEHSDSFMALGDHRVIPRVDVVYLTYNAKRSQPSISLDNVCTISLYELKKDRLTKKNLRLSMSVDAYKHYTWYNTVLSNQLKKDGGPMLLRTFHWYIESSNVDAFMVDDELYEAVSLIIEADVEHWYCARPGWNISGSRVRLRNNKWEHDFAAKAKERIVDCLVPASPPANMRKQNRRVRPKSISLCTINEE
ncbi:uncharacterized protein LOC135708179 [Ochlerotatus camptorhynchus]|uniref:uncharacterized protein LOC135708179 n=1 Tax=Ochlerotatus camptorhynchus TaxID=644619 RepID=UPI0031DD1D05